MDEFVTFYDILEIKKDASSAEIKAAYHALAKKYHPDISTTDNQQEFEEKFKKINEAYSTLSEAKSRQEYDHKLKDLEKEHLEKLIQNTQNQINQLNCKLQQYKEDLRQKQTFSFLHKNDGGDYKTEATKPENTDNNDAFDDTLNTPYVPPVKLKKQIFDILKYQTTSMLKQLAAAAFIVIAVYSVIHFYFSELALQIRNSILAACIVLLIFAGYRAFFTIFTTSHTILMLVSKSSKGVSFVKTKNVLYCINKAASLKNGVIVLILAAITMITIIKVIDNINDLFSPQKNSALQSFMDFYANNLFAFSAYLMVWLCVIYSYVVITMEFAKYVCPSCHSAFSYFYNKTYYTEDGHHVEHGVYYRDYIKNEVTQCDICSYQTTLSFRQKEKVSQQ